MHVYVWHFNVTHLLLSINSKYNSLLFTDLWQNLAIDTLVAFFWTLGDPFFINSTTFVTQLVIRRWNKLTIITIDTVDAVRSKNRLIPSEVKSRLWRIIRYKRQVLVFWYMEISEWRIKLFLPNIQKTLKFTTIRVHFITCWKKVNTSSKLVRYFHSYPSSL